MPGVRRFLFMRRKSVIYLLVWLIATGASALTGSLVSEMPKYKRLADHGLRVGAVVTGKEPENHQSVRYTYKVGAEVYGGIGRAGGINPSFEALAAGDGVIAFYDPGKPQDSILGDPRGRVRSNLVIIAVFSLMPTIALAGGLLKYDRVLSSWRA